MVTDGAHVEYLDEIVPSPKAPGRPARILWVDDEPEFLDTWTGVVQHQLGVGVEKATTHAEARTALKNSHFDLVLMDDIFSSEPGRIPSESAGIDLLKAIRGGKVHGKAEGASTPSKVPVLFLTVMSRERLEPELSSLGCKIFKKRDVAEDGAQTLVDEIRRMLEH